MIWCYILKRVVADLLVVCLGLFMVSTFFKPFFPGQLFWVGFSVYEPSPVWRLVEGSAGVGITAFGINQVFDDFAD